MKHSIDCKEIPPQGIKRQVSSIVITLTLETQGEFDGLHDIFGSRSSATTSEYNFYVNINNLHKDVIIK